VHKINLRKQHQSIDKNFLFIVIALTFCGFIAVADASAPQAINNFNDKYYFVKQQLVWGGVGFIALFIASKIKYTFWEKLATPLFVISVLMLVAVLIPGISYSALGARRWLDLGITSLQPSELTKLTLALYLAKVASKNKSTLSYLIPLALVAGLIMLQPDLGTTMVNVGIGFTQILVAGIPWLHLAGTGAIGGVIVSALIFLSPYRRDRLLTLVQQSSDPLGRDYHIRQILLALGSGGLFGVGFGQSRQKNLFLPEAATDSIFAVIAEEIGFIGGLILLSAFGFLVYKGLKIAKNAPDKFSQVLATGIISWIGIQVVLNIGSMVSLVPLTGVPLPLFSYGGSALVMILFATGILLNISSHAKTK
jgi:cell division protein FtsW